LNGYEKTSAKKQIQIEYENMLLRRRQRGNRREERESSYLAIFTK
jgi:hypothetical protein